MQLRRASSLTRPPARVNFTRVHARCTFGHDTTPADIDMWEDFKRFVEKANVVGLALAVIVGGAAIGLVKAMTDDFLMPIIGAAIPGGEWRTYTLDIGSIKFGVGDFAGAFLNFAIITVIAYQLARLFMKPEQPSPPGPVTKACPFCIRPIAAAATRCPECTSPLA